MINYLTRFPALWLTLYGGGAVLTSAAVAIYSGGAAAGTVAGLLAVAGTIGYEVLTRHSATTHLDKRVTTLAQSQDRLTREVAKARNDVDLMKDDLARAALHLEQQAKKIDERLSRTPGTKQPQPTLRKVQDSFSRIGNRPRGKPAWPTPRRANDYLTLIAEKQRMQTEQEDDSDTTAPPPKFSPTVITELLHHAVEHDRIEIFAQPIVRLPSRRVAYLELFARLRAKAGVYLAAQQYRGLAEKEALLSEVDHLLLAHALEQIRADARRGVQICYFLNISGRTLRDTGFMSALLEFVKSSRHLIQNLILELRQQEFDTLSAPLLEVMRGMARIGCSFSIDNVAEPQFDIGKLSDVNVRFIKLDGQRLAAMSASEDGIKTIERIKTRLDHAGITLVAERLENERDLRELLDFDIDLGEGFLFGKPDLEIAYRPKKTA